VLCGGDSAQAPAVAAVTYREDFGEHPPGACLRADPVHLRADTGGLILFDAGSFALDAEECRALVPTLDAHLAEDHWRLVCQHPQRWYLLGERAPLLETPPLPVVRATPVSAKPYRGADAVTWMGRLNELQMLMHSHPVNQRRAARGQPAVNSVWLWGGGERQPVQPAPGTRIVSDNVFARGMAGESGVPALPLPADASRLPAADGGHTLVLLEQCRDAAAYEEVAAWQAALEALERDWFAPLIAALRARRVEVLQLYALNGRCYRLTRSGLRAFWKGAGEYRSQPGFRQPTANRV
jgi:hypothetical protein